MRILVVDDNRDATDTLIDLLVAYGFDARGCYSGSEALAEALAFSPDLFILDLAMPGLDGIRLCRELRQNPALDGARFVALTGHDSPDLRSQAAAVGFVLYLRKPVLPSELHTTLMAFNRHPSTASMVPAKAAHSCPSSLPDSD
ncbi:MAG: response regulator [Armatimonadetes bacterium]|jgi:DNA-binding response OmpR family regulator|nr:response regulator [Armatimonadota bacterium]